MKSHYSVLMSVYYKEKPEYLRASMESILNQTIPTDNFVLVCDGPLNKELDKVVAEMQCRFGKTLCVVQIRQNSGLGNALNEGIKYCKNELVARMDSDDISYHDRCERQLNVFQENPLVDICSGTIEEFETTPDIITGKRKLPTTNEEIITFSKKRNPFNHPAVMFKRSTVIASGGYDEKYHLFEDYYLWVRLLQKGYVGTNLPETILYMRTPADMYLRRGGGHYAKEMLRFHKWMRQSGWTTFGDFCIGALPHALVCKFPNNVRKHIYKYLHA